MKLSEEYELCVTVLTLSTSRALQSQRDPLRDNLEVKFQAKHRAKSMSSTASKGKPTTSSSTQGTSRCMETVAMQRLYLTNLQIRASKVQRAQVVPSFAAETNCLHESKSRLWVTQRNSEQNYFQMSKTRSELKILKQFKTHKTRAIRCSVQQVCQKARPRTLKVQVIGQTGIKTWEKCK